MLSPRFAIHEVTNVCTRRRVRIGLLWTRCCLYHPLLLKSKAFPGKAWPTSDHCTRFLDFGQAPHPGALPFVRLMEISTRRKGENGTAVVAIPSY